MADVELDVTFESSTVNLDTDFGTVYVIDGNTAVKVIANKYSNDRTYAVDDYVIHESLLYRCITPIDEPEEFDIEKWLNIKLADDVKSVKSALTAKMDKTNPTGAGSLSLNRKANTTVGYCSTVLGINNTASSTASFAEGESNIASNNDAHAEGYATTASGGCSHSEGRQTLAKGSNAHAEGNGTIAKHESQHVFGEFNTPDESTASTIFRGKFVEIVGNGTSESNRSNARTLDWQGNETLAGDLFFNGNTSLKSALDSKVDKTDFYEVAGSTTPITPTMIDKLNFVKNGTEFQTKNDYETYYIPVVSGMRYVWTTGKLSGNPYLRFMFSLVIPANAVSATYLNELQIVNDDVTYEYVATQNGYLCMAVYRNNVSADIMTITENYNGKMGDLEESVKAIEKVVLPYSYLPYSGDKIELNKQIVQIQELINFVDDSAIIPLTTWNGGLAIYKNLAFVTYNSGYVCCFDLNTNTLVASGRTAIIGATNHANNAVFDYGASYSGLPPVYVSRCNEAGTECYVETWNVNLETGLITSTLIQTISYSGALWNGSENVDWCIDCENRKLIMLTNGHLAVFNLPSTAQLSVALTDADIISQTTYPTDYVRQGSCVYLGKLYLLTGFSNEAQMRVIDLSNGNTKSTINIKDFTPTEPEGLCVYDNKIYFATNNGAHGASVDLYKAIPFEK